ncbi:MAG TPA: hypothetical protein VE982_00910 [Gaiellaceae bacterium]|nr:hypothetical protein [Gaiellaceae bacterium]
MEQSFSYPVLFREPGSAPRPGSLALQDGELLLSGGAGVDVRELRVPLGDVDAVRTSRTREERLNGYPVIVIERSTTGPLLVAPLGAGLLTELADLLVSLTFEEDRDERVAVALPLKPNRLERAHELIERGPPFELAALAGVTHTVYVDDERVLFVFEGRHARRTVERLMRGPALWRASLAWRDCAAGRPYATEVETVPFVRPAFSWPAVAG